MPALLRALRVRRESAAPIRRLRYRVRKLHLPGLPGARPANGFPPSSLVRNCARNRKCHPAGSFSPAARGLWAAGSQNRESKNRAYNSETSGIREPEPIHSEPYYAVNGRGGSQIGRRSVVAIFRAGAEEQFVAVHGSCGIEDRLARKKALYVFLLPAVRGCFITGRGKGAHAP